MFYDGAEAHAVTEKQLKDMKPNSTQTSCVVDSAALLLLDRGSGFGCHSADG